MPQYEVKACQFDISRQAMIVDTNVLVTAFHKDDPQYGYARYFLDEEPYQWLIAAAVVVETWGYLVGSRKDWQGGYEFLAWLNTPGKATLILPQKGEFMQEQALVTALQIDCVDAIIGRLAHEITIQCSLQNALPVATYDTKDYWKLKVYDKNLRINIYDMKEFILQDLDP
jgi:hypothetical protein